jgi:hypothetical protein
METDPMSCSTEPTSCAKPEAKSGPHQNTPESIVYGNRLLREAQTLGEMGHELGRQAGKLEEQRDEAYKLAREKTWEAEKVLLGRSRYSSGC